jgi:hypothetical protein
VKEKKGVVGRPTNKKLGREGRTVTLRVMLTPTEMELLKTKAENVSAYVRNRLGFL